MRVEVNFLRCLRTQRMQSPFATLNMTFHGDTFSLCVGSSDILPPSVHSPTSCMHLTNFYQISMWASQVAFSGKESTIHCRRHRDTGLIPGSGISLGGGNRNSLQYSCPKNPMDSPVFLPEESHGQRSLEGYSLWG